MKFLVSLIIVLAAAVLIFGFSDRARNLIGEWRNELPGFGSRLNQTITPKGAAPNGSATSTPNGFRGPAGKPGAGFIGPKSNPPNY